MKRSTIFAIGALTAAILGVGLATPANAASGSDGALHVSAPDYSYLSADSGCHDVPISYSVSPEMEGYDWDISFQISKPDAWGDSTSAYGSTPGAGTVYAYLCGYTDGPGTYTVDATLTSTDFDYNTGPSYQVQTTLLTCSSACPVVKSSTTVSLTQPKSPVRPGDPVSFNGAASVRAPGAASWSPLVKGGLSLQYQRYTSSPWTTVKTLTTDATGRYGGSYAPSVSGYYRVARAANTTQAGSVSPSRYVAVAKAATAVSLTTFTPTTVRPGAALTLGGQASIRNPGASTWAPMVGGGLSVQFRPTTTSPWATVKTTSTNASGAYLTSYVPTRSGYYRVYRAANAKQAESASAAKFAWRR